MKKTYENFDKKILTNIVDNIEVSINAFDKEGRRIFVNPYFYHLSGRKPGSRLSDNMTSGEDKDTGEYITKKVLQVIKSGKIIRIKDFYYHNARRKKKPRKYFDFLIGPIRNGNQEILGAYTMVTDSTTRHLANRRLRRLNYELEKKVIARTKALALMSKEKDMMVSDIAHEIKTILTIIKGNLEMVHLEEKSKNPMSIECFKEIQEEIERMSKITSDLVFISRSHRYAETFDLKNLNLSMLLIDLIKKYKAIVGNNTKIIANINQKSNLTIKGDRDRLNTLFGNLIENAIKFSCNDGSKLLISVEKIDKEAIITFIDNGIGVEENVIEFIFSPFFQTKKTISKENSMTKGFGLGLTICKKIIDAHNGKISASSEGSGKGMTFKVSLPMAK